MQGECLAHLLGNVAENLKYLENGIHRLIKLKPKFFITSLAAQNHRARVCLQGFLVYFASDPVANVFFTANLVTLEKTGVSSMKHKTMVEKRLISRFLDKVLILDELIAS